MQYVQKCKKQFNLDFENYATVQCRGSLIISLRLRLVGCRGERGRARLDLDLNLN